MWPFKCCMAVALSGQMMAVALVSSEVAFTYH